MMYTTFPELARQEPEYAYNIIINVGTICHPNGTRMLSTLYLKLNPVFIFGMPWLNLAGDFWLVTRFENAIIHAAAGYDAISMFFI